MPEAPEKNTPWSHGVDPGERLSVLEERLRGVEKAIQHQAVEYERRLTDLNHAHSRAREDLATYTPREVYDKFLQGFEEWRRSVDAVISAGRAKTALMAAMVATGIGVAGLGFAFINFLRTAHP